MEIVKHGNTVELKCSPPRSPRCPECLSCNVDGLIEEVIERLFKPVERNTIYTCWDCGCQFKL